MKKNLLKKGVFHVFSLALIINICTFTTHSYFRKQFIKEISYMAIISRARLAEITETRLGVKTFSEFLNESERESRTYAVTSIFLSHSHDDLDKNEIKRIRVLFRKLGIQVYIDSNDPSMPPFTNSQTAEKIKKKIKENRKFVFLATNNSISSKWCNWELGYGDAHRYIDNLAIFPISENSGQWNGAEYLRIYPRLEEMSNVSDLFEVVYPGGNKISFLEWLKR